MCVKLPRSCEGAVMPALQHINHTGDVARDTVSCYSAFLLLIGERMKPHSVNVKNLKVTKETKT